MKTILAERRFFIAVYLFQATALVALLLPFLRLNNLQEWDFPGHFAAIWHVRNHLFPWPTGWIPYFYCGYPQGMFYPPLAHYLAAVLSFAVGIGMAMKLLIAASLLLIPVAFYAFARRWGLDDLQASVCSIWMMAVLTLTGERLGTWNLGSDLKSIFNGGLFANTLSLPVLFFFLASFVTGGRQNNWKLSASLLGTLLLLHPLSSIIAGIFVLAALCSRRWGDPQESLEWRSLVLTLGTAFLLGAFWILPFLVYRGYMNPEFVGARWSPVLQLVLINGLALSLCSFGRKTMRPLVLTYFLLCNFLLAGTLCKIELQLTRFTIYLLLFIPIFLLVWIRSTGILFCMAILAAGLGVWGFRSSGTNPAGTPDFDIPDFGRVEGRILSVSPPSHLPSYHVNHDLIPLRTGNASILGVFIESTLNARFLGNLMRTLDPDAFLWGTPYEFFSPQTLGKQYSPYIQDRLRLFDIRYIYTDLKLEECLDPLLAHAKRYVNSYPALKHGSPEQLENLRRRYHTHDEFVDFYLYSVGPGALAEPLSYVPGTVNRQWKEAALRWFMEVPAGPVFIDRHVPTGVREAHPGEQVEVRDTAGRGDRIVLQIHARQDIPVLVKVGYLPTWRLRINGKDAPLYRAAPSLMLIFGHGEAILEYQRPWQEYLGLLFLVLGVALLLFWQPDRKA